jgi:hypothetical protein
MLLRIVLLTVGAVLLLTAILGRRIPGSAAGTAAARWARVAVGLVGVACLAGGVASWLRPPAPQATAASMSRRVAVDLIGPATNALQHCSLPGAPAVPDGATASLQQMAAARSAFQAFDNATNAYVHCVDSAIDGVAQQHAATASRTDLESLKTFGAGAHDTAIDQEQALADEFNAQIRIYKSKHPQ